MALGDLTIQGNVRAVATTTEILPLARDQGATQALLPTGNKSQLAGLPEDVIDRLDLVFYGDPERAVAKTLEL